MPYDPTKPADGALADAAELRAQFAALKAMMDNLQTQINELPPTDTVTDLINANSAGPTGPLLPPNFTVNDPPTQADVQAIADFVTAQYIALSRT